MKLYPLAKDGVFRTFQGEGIMLGVPMVFVRFAGCSVGCPQCDTDYAVAEKLSLASLVDRISRCTYGSTRWVWLTGGEPADHQLDQLIYELRRRKYRIAMATAGTRGNPVGAYTPGGVDFLSVSPHSPASWVQRSGDQLNLVPRLNGLSIDDPSLIDALRRCEHRFSHRYATPLEGCVRSREDCIRWVDTHDGWRLGVQAHKVWGVK